MKVKGIGRGVQLVTLCHVCGRELKTCDKPFSSMTSFSDSLKSK